MSDLYYNSNTVERQATKFRADDMRTRTESSNTDFAVAFESVNLSDKTLLNYYLLSHLLGRVEVNYFNPLEINHSILSKDVYLKNSFFNSVEAVNLHFSDAGVFVLRGNVSGDNVNKGLEALN